jgi:hypothetical protein
MSAHPDQQVQNAFAALRQFARRRSAAERCEMCSRELLPEHEHLVEPANQRLMCACDACAILFDGQAGSKYKRVPRTAYFLNDFVLSDGQWESLMIPIEMAFFFKSTPQKRVIALYPSPAGAVESLLSLEIWDEIVLANPVLREMEADVTALLANRVGASRGARLAEHYLVPIDECYKLVGLLRSHWRGLSGGTEVWREIGAYFAELKSKSRLPREAAHV